MTIVLAVDQQTIRFIKPLVVKRREITRVQVVLTVPTPITSTTIVMRLLLLLLTFKLQIRSVELFLLRRREVVVEIVAEQRTSAFQIQIPVHCRQLPLRPVQQARRHGEKHTVHH